MSERIKTVDIESTQAKQKDNGTNQDNNGNRPGNNNRREEMSPHNILDAYFADIRALSAETSLNPNPSSKLTHQQEINLAEKIQLGKTAEAQLKRGVVDEEEEKILKSKIADGETAYRQFLISNLPLAVSVAKKIRGNGVPFLDLIQEANLGLMNAVEKFDPARGTRFVTYAHPAISNRLIKYICSQGKNICIPSYQSDNLKKISLATNRLEHELGREPTPEELAENLSIELDKIIILLRWIEGDISLQEPVAGDDNGNTELINFVPTSNIGPEAEVIQRVSKTQITDLLSPLTKRQRIILRKIFGINCEPHPEKKIAQEFNLTRQRINQIKHIALKALRRNLEFEVIKQALKMQALQIPSNLPKQQRQVLKMKLGIGCRPSSETEIAETFFYTRRHIRRLIRQGLDAVYENMQESDIESLLNLF